jgi:hypothetical protein
MGEGRRGRGEMRLEREKGREETGCVVCLEWPKQAVYKYTLA